MSKAEIHERLTMLIGSGVYVNLNITGIRFEVNGTLKYLGNNMWSLVGGAASFSEAHVTQVSDAKALFRNIHLNIEPVNGEQNGR